MIRMSYSFLLTFCLLSCKHTPELLVSDTSGTSFCMEPAGDTLCDYNWTVPEPATFYNSQPYPGINYMCPSVNPNNPNQFVCFKQNYGFPPKCDIITYDMNTNVENVLFTYSGSMIGNLNWGKKNWIAFSTGPGSIRIFKSDGSNDYQIVASSGMNMGGGTGPAWSIDGNYIFYNAMINSGQQAAGIICDTNGVIISTYHVAEKPSWNSDNIILGGGGVKVVKLDLNSNTYSTVTTLQNEIKYDQILSIEWLPDNRYGVFCKHRGLYRVDSQTGEVVLMKERCDMKNYKVLSVSNEGGFILCEKVVSRHNHPASVEYRYEIWKMDFNGCNEVRVLPRE